MTVLGLLILAVLYLALLIVTTRGLYGWAKREGWSRTRCLATAAIGFLVFYLPVFWDQIPTFVRHQYYCSKEAEFSVYQAPDQWSKDNPAAVGTLVQRNEPRTTGHHGRFRFWTTERFFTDRIQDQNFAHALSRTEEIFYDAATQQPIARAVNFYRGKHGNVLGLGGSFDDIRQYFVLGMGNRECGDPSPTERMRRLRGEFRTLGEGK